MAINGPGFFVMHGVNGTGYSRNGQFQVDKSGNIVSATGENLQGWPAASGVVATSGPTSNLTISTASIPPVQTNSIAVSLNLDSRATAPADVSLFNPLDVNSYNYSTSSTVYDSLGNARMDTMYFALAAPAVGSAAVATTAASVGTTNTVASTAGLVMGEQVTDGAVATTITGIAADGKTFTTAAALTAAAAAPPVNLSFGPQAAASPTLPVVAPATASTVQLVAPDSTIGLSVGQTISSAVAGDYPAGTTITSINAAANSFTTSAPASLGTGAITFGAVSGNVWNVFTSISDPNGAAGTYIYPTSGAPTAATPWTPLGTLTFNGVTGALVTPGNGQMSLPAGFLPSFPGLAANPTVGINYNFTGATQYGASNAVTKMTVNGYTTGNLVGYAAAANGQITGSYSNGQTQLLGQVALATFPDNQGLQEIGDNEWAATIASGPALTGAPGVGLNGVLQTSSVENSNTDLTSELVNMITAQRNYQANAQTIKTQDAIMQTLINMR
jgi:flagellar hook protein FlgE